MTSIERERIEGMSVDEFLRLYDEAPFELIRGVRVPLSPTKRPHSIITRNLFRALDAFCSEHKLGEVFSETTFVTSDITDWVKGSRQPDVMFINNERYAAALAHDDPEGPFILVPTLAVEIMSPTDRLKDVLDKVALYLSDGVQLVWIVNRKKRIVTVYQADADEVIKLTIKDTLTGDDVIPGFSIPVAALFEGA